jgi:hypothetical protein
VSGFGVRRATIWPLAAVLSAVLAVSACGGTSGNSAQRNPAPSATTNSGLPGAVVPAQSGAPGSPSAPDSGSPSAPDSGSPSAPPSGTAPSPVPASQYLDAMTPVSGSGATSTGSAQVNGQYFADSVALDLNPGPENVSFNLEREWRSLQATVGLSDDSPEAEKVRFQVIADQRIIYDHTFVLGQSQQINLNVSHVLRLELVATLASDYVGQTAAVWGNANLLS